MTSLRTRGRPTLWPRIFDAIRCLQIYLAHAGWQDIYERIDNDENQTNFLADLVGLGLRDSCIHCTISRPSQPRNSLPYPTVLFDCRSAGIRHSTCFRNATGFGRVDFELCGSHHRDHHDEVVDRGHSSFAAVVDRGHSFLAAVKIQWSQETF